MSIGSKLRHVKQFIQNFEKNWSKKHFWQIDLKGVKMTYVDFQNNSDQFL